MEGLMQDNEQRLKEIEQRLEKLEQALGNRKAREITAGEQPEEETQTIPDTSQAPLQMPDMEWPETTRPAHRPHSSTLTIGSILGWSGATALVLAMAYLIQLAISEGWLTPARQIVIATLFGISLIVAGLLLRKSDRDYASYLPAGGVIILFLTVYGAHLYYPLISSMTAISLVMAICILSLWLCRIFDSDIYAFFAVIGSYTVPFLFPQLRNNTIDLVIYFSAWSAIFTTFSIIIARRSILLLSLYLALIFFDLIWRMNIPEQWVHALLFQCAQLLIFGIGTALYSIRLHSPMERETAYYYLPALLIFYSLQYSLLKLHLPAYAPWIATGSAAVLLACYALARVVLKQPIPGGRFLVGAYIAMVLFHAGYLESLPDSWAPWVGLIAAPLALLLLRRAKDDMISNWPVPLAFALIFAINYAQVITDSNLGLTFGKAALYLLYPLELYAGYYLACRNNAFEGFKTSLLYAGHVAALSAVVYLLDTRLAVSLCWGAIALACLVLALKFRDRMLGQSSLFIFGISGGKVLLYDLADATPLIRIACLLALGLSFYAGGWMYRKLDFPDETEATATARQES